MKFFLDSAKIDEIRYAYQNWKIDGVTTNPKHIKTSGESLNSILELLSDEFKEVNFPISIEIDPHLTEAKEMIPPARKYSEISSNFVIKIPCTEQGLVAAKILTEENVKINVTLVFSATQALQAGRLGVTYCSPFIGWQEASGVNCFQFLSDIVNIYANYNFKTEIIAAAIRNGAQIADAATIGIDIVTAGFDVYKECFEHPFTEKGLKIFQQAWNDTQQE